MSDTALAGDIGVISGIQFSPPPLPLPRINIQGTSGDDWVVFNPLAGEISVNGLINEISPETTRVHFFGRGGVDHVTSLGNPDQEEIAVLQSTNMTVVADSYFFAAHDVAEPEFEGISQSDTCIVFDSEAEEQLLLTPRSVQFQGDDSLLQATNVGNVHVFISGGNDSAKMRGSIKSECFNANMQNRMIRMTGSGFLTALSGFETVNANGRTGERNFATIVDSNELAIVFFRGDFGRFLNDTTDFSVRLFERVNYSSASGNDMGVFQTAQDSTLAGNEFWETLVGIGDNNTIFGLEFLQICKP